MSETRVIHVHDMPRFSDAVYIGRRAWAGTGKPWLRQSPLANPFRIGKEFGRAVACGNYRVWLYKQMADGNREVLEALIACRGKPLACWCRHDGEQQRPSNECHGDAIIEVLNGYSDDNLREMGGT